MNKRWFCLTATLTISVIVQLNNVSAQEATSQIIPEVQYHVRVTASEADLHTEPNWSSEVVVQARKGDIFESYGTEGEWHKIGITTKWPRFLHQSLAERTEEPRLQVSPEVREKICVELEEARRQASSEVRALDIRGFEGIQLILDRYQLPVFRKYGISPSLNHELECAEILFDIPTRLDIAIAVMIGIAQYVVIGVLISTPLVVYRRIKAKVKKPRINRQVLWRTVVSGTLMSITVIAIGVAVINGDLIFILWYGGVLWWLQVLFGIIGFLVVGSFFLALRLAHRRIEQQRQPEGENSENDRT